MSVYIFNILNPFKDNDNITTIMTYFDTNLRFFPKKRWFLKTAKTFYIPSNFLLYIRKHLIIQNKNKTWMIIKDWTFYDQNLQSVAILHKNWEFLSSYFLTFIILFFFFQNIFRCNIPLGRSSVFGHFWHSGVFAKGQPA